MRPLGALALALSLALAGCGSDGRRERAWQMAETASRALDVVDRTSGSESLDEGARAAIDPARASARQWAAQTHAALDLWRTSESRSLALETAAPCLGRALGRLRERLAEHDRPIPESLRQAEALARTATEGRARGGVDRTVATATPARGSIASMRHAWIGLALGLAAIAGCGGDGRHARARDAVMQAATAIDDARSAGGEDAAVGAALDRSQRWLSDTEQSVELWGSSGAFAYETTAPCLASSLAELRTALAQAGRPVPPSLEEAEALVLDEGTGRCAERPRSQ